jgi:hypothetical protein
MHLEKAANLRRWPWISLERCYVMKCCVCLFLFIVWLKNYLAEIPEKTKMFVFVFFFVFFPKIAFVAPTKADSNEASNNQASNSNKNVLVAQICNLSDPSKARSVKHLSFKPSPSDQSKDYCTLDLLPTAAESLFPWRRDRSYQSLGFGISWTQTLTLKLLQSDKSQKNQNLAFLCSCFVCRSEVRNIFLIVFLERKFLLERLEVFHFLAPHITFRV